MTAIASSISAHRIRSPRVSLLVGGLGLLVVIVLAMHRGDLLRLGFPVAATATAIWVYRYADFPVYAAFTWWFWFVTPGLRRIVDYQSGGFDATNPISLTPLLVSSIAILTVLRRLPELQRARFWPWVLALLCIVYGFFAGVLHNGVLAAFHALISWLVPLFFGLAIALEWRRYPASANLMRRTFVWGGLLLSLYGVWQFLSPPTWDLSWVAESGMASIAYGIHNQLRVFSLMNGPLLFAITAFATLFLAFSARGPWRVVVLGAAAVALMLTLVRSVWLMTLPAIVVYLYALPIRSARRVVIAGLAAIALLWGVVALVPRDIGGPVISMIQERAVSLGSLNQDLSYSQRTGFIEQVSGVVLENPLGHGLGSTGVSSALGDPTSGIRDFDSGILAVLYALGWFAGVALLAAIFWIVASGMPRREPRGDLVAKAARAILVGLLCLTLGGNILEGMAGMLFWSFAGLLVASHQWQGSRVVRSAGVR